MSKPPLSPLITAVKQFAAKRYEIGKSIFGIGLHSPYESVVAKVCDNFLPSSAQILAANDLAREQFAKIGPVNPDAGMVLGFDAGVASKKHAKVDDVREATVVVVPGLGGGDTASKLRATLGEFQRIFPKEKCLIYSPEAEGVDRAFRHARGMLYYVDHDSILEESKNFFEKVIKPRITDKSGKLIPPEVCPKLVLASFSIGCREAESHWKYFQNYLEKEGVEKKEVKKYLDSIALFNLASPRNWQAEDVRPFTINTVSITDVGSKKPDRFFLDFLFNSEMNSREISKIARPSLAGEPMEMLAIAGFGVVTNGSVRTKDGPFISNPLGHNLANYVDGVLKNKTLSELIEPFRVFLKSPSLEFEKFKKELLSDDVAAHKKKFVPPSPEGMEALFESLMTYQEAERKAEKNAPFASRLFRTRSPESACSHAIPDLANMEIDPAAAAQELLQSRDSRR